MTTTPTTPLNRVLNVTRLHFTNKWNLIILPWLILGFIFLVNYVIWWLVYSASSPSGRRSMAEGTQYSGAVSYIFVYMLVIAVQAITLTFSFALSYSVTRRDYYLGTVLTFILLCATYGGGMTILSYIEDATGGWGLGGYMFHSVYIGDGQWWTRLFIYFVGLAFFIMIGTLFGTVYMRWRLNGMVVLSALVAILILGSVALITFTNSWPAVGAWFVAAGPLGVVTWLLVPTVGVAVAGFSILRGATPKS